jgi:ubiquinone/menaquinone biosynthesis C-methylase UbiE
MSEDFFKNQYPMSYQKEEAERLDLQADQLDDPSIDHLVKNSKRCLEIGCGVGSNLKKYRALNSTLEYTGIDISEFAIEEARKTFPEDASTSFQKMDCRNLEFPKNSFDLIVSRLVLWSVGKDWTQVLHEVHKSLRPGGYFYAFEPDDQFLLFHPVKKEVCEIISLWQKRVFASGLNPYIGRGIGPKIWSI